MINLNIEINKDIDNYQESVVLGLSAKQLIFSSASLVCGGGLVLLLYPHIGLTASAYVAIPVVAPIALGGFYTFNGMSFYDVMKRKIGFMFLNKPLLYSSTECEQGIKDYQRMNDTEEKSIKSYFGRLIFGKKGKPKNDKEMKNKDSGNQEEFERMKKKMKKVIIGSVVTIALVAVGSVIYKVTK